MLTLLVIASVLLIAGFDIARVAENEDRRRRRVERLHRMRREL